MANQDKYAKTIEDENLDAVAGGASDMAKDIRFLQDLGVQNINKNSSMDDVKSAWKRFGISAHFKGNSSLYSKPMENPEQYNGKYKRNGISRNDAMIMTMRKQNKYLNLENYI